MAAIGKKSRESVEAARGGHGNWHAAGGSHSLNFGIGKGREHDQVVAIPRSASTGGRIAQRLRWTTARANLLEFALGKEPNLATIRGPERQNSAVGAWHRSSLKPVHYPQP